MAGSIVVAVRKAVVAGLKLEQALLDAKADVTYAYNWSDTQKRVSIFTNNARATHDPAALKSGRNFRNEQMDFDIVVLVKGVNIPPDENAEKALDVGTVVEEFIADHKSNELDVEGLLWIQIVNTEMTDLGAKNGSITEITYTVRYNARLT